MGVVPESTRGICFKNITEGASGFNTALCQIFHAVHPGCVILSQTMPMHCGGIILHSIFNIDLNNLFIIYNQSRARHLAIHSNETSKCHSINCESWCASGIILCEIDTGRDN